MWLDIVRATVEYWSFGASTLAVFFQFRWWWQVCSHLAVCMCVYMCHSCCFWHPVDARVFVCSNRLTLQCGKKTSWCLRKLHDDKMCAQRMETDTTPSPRSKSWADLCRVWVKISQVCSVGHSRLGIVNHRLWWPFYTYVRVPLTEWARNPVVKWPLLAFLSREYLIIIIIVFLLDSFTWKVTRPLLLKILVRTEVILGQGE